MDLFYYYCLATVLACGAEFLRRASSTIGIGGRIILAHMLLLFELALCNSRDKSIDVSRAVLILSERAIQGKDGEAQYGERDGKHSTRVRLTLVTVSRPCKNCLPSCINV